MEAQPLSPPQHANYASPVSFVNGIQLTLPIEAIIHQRNEGQVLLRKIPHLPAVSQVLTAVAYGMPVHRFPAKVLRRHRGKVLRGLKGCAPR